MKKKMKVAIIGCGGIAQTHLAALLGVENVQITAVCDTVRSRAVDMASKVMKANKNQETSEFREVKIFEDWHELLKDKEIESVHICTPHYLHTEMAIESMKSGKHTLTEKPMAISLEDAKHMNTVSKETGRQLGVCFQNRFNNTSLKMRELIDAGKIGNILGGRAFVTWNRGADYYASGAWRGTWDEEGGGVLINQSIHTMDLLQWFLGEPIAVKGTHDTRLLKDFIEVEDVAEASITFSNKTNGLFYATNNYCTDSSVFLEIVGSEAVMKLDNDLIIQYKGGTIEKITEEDIETGGKAYWGSGHLSLIKNWYQCLEKGEPFSISGEVAINALKIVLGVYSSQKTGLEVELT